VLASAWLLHCAPATSIEICRHSDVNMPKPHFSRAPAGVQS
jgi:hypothetical protein